MKWVSRVALSACLLLGAASFAAIPATAQQARSFSFSKEERAALLPVQQAIQTNNFQAAAAALPAARSAAKGADARYMVGYYQLRTGIGTGNREMQAHAIDIILSSGAVPAADLPALYSNQGAVALIGHDLKKAEAAYTKLVELTPNDPNAVMTLAEVKHDVGKVPEAVTLMERAIDIRRASGQVVPESWYKRALKTAFDAKVAPQSLKFAQALAASYPTDENIRDAVIVHREVGELDQDARLGLYRLMRASNAFAGERDYFEAAEALEAAGLGGEANALLKEGASKNMVDTAKGRARDLLTSSARKAPTKAALTNLEKKAASAATGADALGAADAFYGAGDYAKAAELYRIALQKGSVDANIVNARLGMALALAGQKAEAEAAFRAVQGPRSNLASLWLAWLSRRA